MNKERQKVVSRNEAFVQRTATRIWQELPSNANPYIAESCRCHGYDLTELMASCSFTDVLYLLFRGELPDTKQSILLNQLMIALINPGPRHPATRAAMNAGVGKTDPVHILPIALTILGGNHLGAGEIEGAMRFLRKHKNIDPTSQAKILIENSTAPKNEGDWHITPGFGRRYGDIDLLPQRIVKQLIELPGESPCLEWGNAFANELGASKLGWLTTGVAAAAFVDLGLQPKAGAGLFQLLCAPGLLAHGLELANKPITAMPFVDDSNYVIETR